MRWFWLFIASLVVLTGTLYTVRVNAERAAQEALRAQAEQAAAESTPMRRSRSRDRAQAEQTTTPPTTPPTAATPESSTPDPQPDPVADPVADSVADATQPEPEAPAMQADEAPTDTTQAETAADDEPNPGSGFDSGALIAMFNEADAAQEQQQEQAGSEASAQRPAAQDEQPEEQTPPGFAEAMAQAAQQSEGATAQGDELSTDNAPDQAADQAAEKAPSYQIRPDGSFRVIDADIWVQGAGTQPEPYVLSWEVLKTVEQSYDPRNGKDDIPDWVSYLDGKIVQIEGNTLVPVIASTTRELLVMQNPWDGCCIGVPPTPYDAVEVVLNHDVDFGNSAVGYGSVQGTFYLDPYIVDGWVLGLYIIEDARYRSGEGVEFPEF